MNRQIRNDLEEARRARRIRQDAVEHQQRRHAYAIVFVTALVLGALLAWTITHGPVAR